MSISDDLFQDIRRDFRHRTAPHRSAATSGRTVEGPTEISPARRVGRDHLYRHVTIASIDGYRRAAPVPT